MCVALALLAGCSSREDVRDSSDPSGASSSLALVNLSYTRGAGRVRFEAQGRFARFAPDEATRAATLLGLPDDESIPLDTCRVVDSAAELDRALAVSRSTTEVRLVDAGRLLARGPVDQTALVAKHYPELTPFVAGVVYGAEDGPPLALEPGERYDVSGDGGEDVGPFQAQVTAPRAFPELEVPAYHRGSDLEVRWLEAGEVSSPLLLTVSWSWRTASDGGAREVRCRVRDDGSFTVPREALAGLPPLGRLATAEVSALRARRAPLVAPGMMRGELCVGLRDVAPLVVSPELAEPQEPGRE